MEALPGAWVQYCQMTSDSAGRLIVWAGPLPSGSMPTSLADRRAAVLSALGLTGSESFAFTEVTLDGTTATLHYELDGVGALAETWNFHGVTLTGHDPARQVAIERAARLLHLLAGVSYFKATLPPTLATGPVSQPVRDLMSAVVGGGLAELAWVNDLDLAGHFHLPPPTLDPVTPAPVIGAANGPLVPVGGGKDSIVTLEAVRDLAPTLFAVNPRGPITRTIDTAALPAITVTRTLDPTLFDLNDRGAVNGHVPVTAIVSAGAVVAAVAGGHEAVLLSNERSADQATVVTEDGRHVNHQWSKTTAFERAFAAIVTDEVAADVSYLSLLRPLSELEIGRRFTAARTPDGHPWDAVFNSCNRAFHLRGQRREWCGECPKCHFVFLALAPFMGRDRVTAIWGRNLLDDADLVDGFADLAGIGDHKPFECVGEEEESAASLAWLGAQPDWANDVVLASLRDRLPVGPAALDAHLAPPDLSKLAATWADALALQAPAAPEDDHG